MADEIESQKRLNWEKTLDEIRAGKRRAVRSMVRRDPQEELRSFTKGLECLLDTDDSYEAIAPPGVVRWVVGSLNDFLTGKHKTLDQALGLKRSQGRPSASEADEIPERILRAWRMAVNRTPWDEIAKAIGHNGDSNDLRKKIERHHEAITRMEADRLFRDLHSDDGQKM